MPCPGFEHGLLILFPTTKAVTLSVPPCFEYKYGSTLGILFSGKTEYKSNTNNSTYFITGVKLNRIEYTLKKNKTLKL